MSFGYSVGDFISLGQLAWQVYKSCKDAPGSFKNISSEVLSLHAVLKEIEETLSGFSLSQAKRANLLTITSGYQDTLRDLQSLVNKYESLGTQTKRTWDRMRWHSNDIAELRARLTSNTVMLTAFISTSQFVVERKLDKFMQEYQEGKHEPSVLTMQSIESLSLDEKQMWRSIRKELENIGISVAAFDANKNFILDWFKTAINTGAFEEETLEENSSSIQGEDDLDQSSEDHRSATACQGISQGPSLPQRERAAISELSEEESQGALNSKQLVSRPDGPRDSSKAIEIRALSPIRDPKQRKRPPRIAALVAWLLRYNKSLQVASMEGDEATVRKLLLVKGIDAEFRYGFEKRTPLHLAAVDGHEAVVKLLLEKEADVESKDTNIQTPLSLAATRGHEPVVKLLLEKEADVESKDTDNRTPLSLAAGNGHKAVVKLLLEKEADVESKDTYNWTPLSLAAMHGREAVVKLLLEKGADVESKDTYNRTPLSLATGYRHKAVVKLLLEKGANDGIRYTFSENTYI